MACTNCQDCFLVTDDCIAKYTPLKGFVQADLTDVIELTNAHLEKVTGTCDLCDSAEGQDFSAVLASVKFIRYYTNLIYYFWLVRYGGGKASKEGYIEKLADEFSEFKVKDRGDIQQQIKGQKQIVDDFEKSFVTLFFESHSTCKENTCTCEACTTGSGDCCNYHQTGYGAGDHLVFPNGNRSIYNPYPQCEDFDEDLSVI